VKLSPFSTFFIALAATVACTAGYALLDNPAPGRTAAVLPPTQPEEALAGEPRIAGCSPAGGQQAGSETPGSAAAEPSPGIQPPAGSVQFQAAGMTRDDSAWAAAGVRPGQWTARAAADPAPASLDASRAPSSALIPLAFRPLPAGLAASNPRLRSALEALQQNFIAAVGGPNQDPTDPAYYERWITAQQSSDELYRLQIGDSAYLLQQIAINRH
jgi:hypothetical protein